MTIRKGEPWGEPVERPAGLVIAGSDAELASLLIADESGAVGVSAGDLHRSLGSPPDRHDMQRLPIDVLEVVADDRTFTAVAHVLVRRGWWRGSVIAAMNVDHLGPWNVAPPAHPNDGRVDIVEIDRTMPLRERWQARSRLAGGTHIPHPRISVRRVTEASWTFERPHTVWVDGDRVTAARSVSVTVRPDAYDVVV